MAMAFGLRACGSRVAGGVYLEVDRGPDGQPLEYFLYDPPRPVDADVLGLSAVGVKVFRRPGSAVYDVWDIVGGGYYPNVADILEEGRRMGFSRRVPHTLDFGLLTAESRLILLHRRAIIANLRPAYVADWRPRPPAACPRRRPQHAHPDVLTQMCVGAWWQDVEGGDLVAAMAPGDRAGAGLAGVAVEDARAVVRTVGTTTYAARSRPPGVVPDYRLGIVAALPLGGIAVVEDRDTGIHEDRAGKARRARGVPVGVVPR